MKPFDLKKALEGELLITKDGRRINIKVKNVNCDIGIPKPIYASDGFYYNLEGHYLHSELINLCSESDLFMQEDSDLKYDNLKELKVLFNKYCNNEKMPKVS